MPHFRINPNAPGFQTDLKAAIKKHPSLKEDLEQLFATLEERPDAGDSIPSVASTRKIRMGVKQANIGKRRGYRLIYHVDIGEGIITPLRLHYKPEIQLISPKEIAKAVDEMLQHRNDK